MNWSFISYCNQLQVLKGLIDFHFSLQHYLLFHVKLCYFNPVHPLQYTDELFCSKYAKAMGKLRWKIVRPFSALLLSINLGIMFSRNITARIHFPPGRTNLWMFKTSVLKDAIISGDIFQANLFLTCLTCEFNIAGNFIVENEKRRFTSWTPYQSNFIQNVSRVSG